MARDRSKNAYFTVSLPRDSETLCALRSDAEETGVSIPQLLAVRIADWYRFGKEVRQSVSVLPDPVPGREAASTDNQRSANGHDLLSRASAAALVWGNSKES